MRWKHCLSLQHCCNAHLYRGTRCERLLWSMACVMYDRRHVAGYSEWVALLHAWSWQYSTGAGFWLICGRESHSALAEHYEHASYCPSNARPGAYFCKLLWGGHHAFPFRSFHPLLFIYSFFLAHFKIFCAPFESSFYRATGIAM